jgi:hypothetical protein
MLIVAGRGSLIRLKSASAPGARPTLVGTAGLASSGLTPTYPSGISAGDRLVFVQGAVCESTGNVTTATFSDDSSTWSTLVSDVTGSAGSRDVKMKVWHKTAAGTESGSVADFSRSGGSLINDISAIFVVHGANATLDASDSSNGSDDPITAPDLTVADINRLGVLATLFGDDAGAYGSYSGGSGTDFAVVGQVGSSTGADRRIGLHSANLDTSVSGKQETTARNADSWVVIGMVFSPS